MLPVLAFLLLVAYVLLTMLVIEQGSTIDSQRNLIRELFSDSNQLTAMKSGAGHRTPPPAAAPKAGVQPAPGQGNGNCQAAPNKKVRPRPRNQQDTQQDPLDFRRSNRLI